MKLLARGERDWRSRCVAAADAIASIPPGAHVFVGGGCATPRTVLAELEDRAAVHPGLRLIHFVTNGVSGDPAVSSVLHHRSFFLGTDMAGLVGTGRVDYVPMPVSELPGLMRRGRLPIDVAIVQVSPPDGDGMCSLGVSVDVTRQAVRTAKIVIAEINPAMPRTGRHSLVPFDRLDHVVEVAPEVIEYLHPEVGAVAEQIARYVARLVDDGATLQVGFGRVANEVLRYLGTRRDLGIHSDVITEPLVDLVAAGVVTGRRKLMSRGRVVASLALGTRRLYDLIDNDPRFVLRPIDQVSRPEIVAAQHRMTSITQAFTVDLTGQVCAEAWEGAPYAGVAAQADFHRGAVLSTGGRAIVCLSSTLPDGASAIRPSLGPREAVTIPRWNTRWVVTEYGSAYLHGRSVRERAIALIEIAHPDHRGELLSHAVEQGLVPEGQQLRSRSAYPVEEEQQVTLRDGTSVLIRPTRTTDAPLVQDLFFKLRPEDVRTRFFRNLSSLTLQMAEHLCSVGYEDEMAFAAEIGGPEQPRIIAASSYFVDPSTGLADAAYMVDPHYQGKGLGTAMHAKMVDYARRHGVSGFSADVLVGNDAMLRVFEKSSGTLQVTEEDGVYEVVLRFDRPTRGPA